MDFDLSQKVYLQTYESLKHDIRKRNKMWHCRAVTLREWSGAAGDCGIVEDELAQWTEDVFSALNSAGSGLLLALEEFRQFCAVRVPSIIFVYQHVPVGLNNLSRRSRWSC